ncbi:MAG: recombination mediator RecR [Bdellovibrionota bacterium]
MLHISALEKLVHELSQLPGVGHKSAQRLAYFILRSPTDYTDHLSEALLRVRAEVHECAVCYNFTDTDYCRFCTDPHRDDSMVCVVEEPVNIVRVESSGAFKGRYHVLHGAISPLEGIRPQNLKIQPLVDRIQKGFEGVGPKISEVILALDPDLEGDTTVLYINKLLQPFVEKGLLKVTRIAHGIPMGSDLDYVDDRTMGRALENRIEL